MSETGQSRLTAKIVILGGGHGGGVMATQLRQWGHTGEIVMIGEEAIVPYQRPPLSKAFLKGEASEDSLKLKPDKYYHDQKITLRLGARATRIDAAQKFVELEDGERFTYEILIIATGARARKLTIPGSELRGLHELRTLQDAEALKEIFKPGKRIAIVGGGYIGLEAAASARSFNAEAIVIERESRVLARVACEELSNFFENYHRARGVEILDNASVSSFDGDSKGFVSAVNLEDGRKIACDAALIGVGALPNMEIGQAAGLECKNGIVVDEHAQTSDPNIFAIGDVTWRPMPLYECWHRLESVPNAVEQARQAAAVICGKPDPAPEVPWFWSDQYDLKLQIVGVPFEAERRVVRGSVENAKFAVFHLKGDRLLAVEAVNSAGEFVGGKTYILSQKPVSVDKLSDPAIPMKAVAL